MILLYEPDNRFCPQVVVMIYRRKQKMLADQMNKRMEELEFDIRSDIRQGQSEFSANG